MSAHLATCPNCGEEMDVTDVGPYTRVRCPSCEEEVRVKTEVGSYRLVRRVAVGGMSVVFVARDLTLDREIAVKVLSEEFSADEKREEEFRREAKLTATVSHPNVVRVFTVGRAFGRYYIAMELVSGPSLDERMSVHGALPEDQVNELAIQVVDGLRAAAAVGLIHRDIKPGNILIDEQGTAKIVDFGLSLLMEGGTAQAEELWASPYYVAPEALRHAPEDQRSDIYALGATLYHALAGVTAFEGKELSTRALREAKKHITPLKQAAPWLTSEIVQTVEKAMAYNPDRRFQNYEDFRLSLEVARTALQAKGPRVPVHGAVRAQRRERQDTHRKAWIVGAASLLLALLVAVSFLIFKYKTSAGERTEPDTGADGPLIVPGSDPTFDPAAAMEINTAYERAREALRDDDFVVAEQQFLVVWDHEKSPPPTAAWACFEAAVCCYLDGRGGDARQHLVELYDFLVETRQLDTKLGRRLHSAIEVLTSLAFVPDERVPKVLADPFRATMFFAMALKAWEQGQMERAYGMFSRLSRAGPWKEAEWMADYQALAERYVSDHKRMQKADHTIEGKSRAQVEAAIEALEEIYLSLQTRGRARFNLKVWQAALMERLRQLRERRVTPGWEEFREELTRDFFLPARFGEAMDRLGEAQAEGEFEHAQREAWLILCPLAEAFLADLAKALGPGADGVEVASRKGDTYSQIIGSRENGLLVEKNGAALVLSWGEIDPRSLLLVHRKWVAASDDQGEKERRLLEAAAYAWLNGLQGEANGFAEELSVLKPEFEAEWGRVRDALELE